MSARDNQNMEVADFAHKPLLAAIVTGGAGEGIGHGITESLLAEGWSVLVVDRDADRCRDLLLRSQQLGGSLRCLVADITQPDTAHRAVQEALQAFNRLDGLVNNAGVGLLKPIAEVTDEEFERLLDIDFRAAFRFSRAAILEMHSAGGAIVNVGSVHARQTFRGYGMYGSIKAALEGLTRGIAIDYGSAGIRANCVHPGMVMSPQNWALIAGFDPNPEAWVARYAATKQTIPSIVTARQVGDLVAWLLGPKSATTTGQAIMIDGGTTAMLYEKEAAQ